MRLRARALRYGVRGMGDVVPVGGTRRGWGKGINRGGTFEVGK